jgi:hypothetical protein
MLVQRFCVQSGSIGVHKVLRSVSGANGQLDMFLCATCAALDSRDVRTSHFVCVAPEAWFPRNWHEVEIEMKVNCFREMTATYHEILVA